MERYVFEGVHTKMKANELLRELRETNSKIVGVSINYINKTVEIDFMDKPSDDELTQIKNMINASRYYKAELI